MKRARVAAITAMAHVADVAAAAAFYAKLGFEEQGRFDPEGGALAWVSLRSGVAELMLALASEPVIPDQQAVLFYLYCADAAAMRAQLSEDGLAPGPIAYPFYNPRGEFRLIDPDGYVVMVTHL